MKNAVMQAIVPSILVSQRKRIRDPAWLSQPSAGGRIAGVSKVRLKVGEAWRAAGAPGDLLCRAPALAGRLMIGWNREPARTPADGVSERRAKLWLDDSLFNQHYLY